MIIYTDVLLAKKYGLDLAIFATRIYEASIYVGVRFSNTRCIYTTIATLHESLFSFWSIKHVRALAKQAEDLKIITLRKEIPEIKTSGHGMWLSIDYENTPFVFPVLGTLSAGVDGGVVGQETIATPIDAVVKWWNELGEVPRVEKITPKRVTKIKCRIKDGMAESLSEIGKQIKGSKFLLGRTSKWTITFDWLIENDTNWVKVLEGNYSDETKKKIIPIKEKDSSAISAMEKKMCRDFEGGEEN